MTPEAKVKKQVKRILDIVGCYYFFPQTGGYGSSGVPDIVVCHKGKFIGIECKAGDNKLTELQKHNIDLINNNKGLAIVVNESNIEELITLMKGL
jgi:Holliday junction resolvase